MRRGIKLTMSVASVAAVGLGLRMSAQPHPSVGVAEPHATGGSSRASVRPAPSVAHRSPAARGVNRRASLTVAGDVVSTAYGPVQVEVTLRAGRITQARALARPSGNGRTEEINSYAIPQLDQETIAAQGSQIDTVSGATFTSEGYRQSLQSALDAAHRAGGR